MENRHELPISISCGPAAYEYKKSSDSGTYEVLQSLRNDKVFCDITLETQDGFKVFAHKVILASASPYFHAMFTNFEEKNKDLVVIRDLDSTALKLLVDFIYSGKIKVTGKNVQALLSSANILLINDVNEACCEFLQKELHPTNCLGIKTFANLHNCTKLLTSSELYIQQNFSEVVKGDDFLSLSSEEVVKFIFSDELSVPSEEKVVECVIRWLKYDLDSRKCNLPKLMEHVRLPLASKNYINLKVVKEPLLNNCPECKKFIYEALQFHILKSNQPDRVITIPECIRYKPRLGDKVIFVVGGSGYRSSSAYRTEWYDPKTNGWNFGPEMTNPRYEAGLAVLYDHFVFFMGGYNSGKSHRSVVVLDLFSESPCWKPTVAMLVKRHALGVGVINNNLYAVGGHDGTNQLNSAEKFDCTTKKWRMISSMSTTRFDLGVGVLNNLLYAVGGWDDSGEGLNFVECYHPSLDTWTPVAEMCKRRSKVGGYGGINHLLGDTLNSVECYHPNLDTWTPLAEMCKCRSGLGVGVLDGVLYAIGGYDERESLKSVEAYRPSTGAWTSIADMNFPRQSPGVVALDGLLYVIGGLDGDTHYDSVEFYNPISDTWNMLDARMNVARQSTSVVTIIRPPHF